MDPARGDSETPDAAAADTPLRGGDPASGSAAAAGSPPTSWAAEARSLSTISGRGEVAGEVAGDAAAGGTSASAGVDNAALASGAAAEPSVGRRGEAAPCCGAAGCGLQQQRRAWPNGSNSQDAWPFVPCSFEWPSSLCKKPPSCRSPTSHPHLSPCRRRRPPGQPLPARQLGLRRCRRDCQTPWSPPRQLPCDVRSCLRSCPPGWPRRRPRGGSQRPPVPLRPQPTPPPAARAAAAQAPWAKHAAAVAVAPAPAVPPAPAGAAAVRAPAADCAGHPLAAGLWQHRCRCLARAVRRQPARAARWAAAAMTLFAGAVGVLLLIADAQAGRLPLGGPSRQEAAPTPPQLQGLCCSLGSHSAAAQPHLVALLLSPPASLPACPQAGLQSFLAAPLPTAGAPLAAEWAVMPVAVLPLRLQCQNLRAQQARG